MSLAFWTAVLSVLSPVSSLSIGTWQGQISPSSLADRRPLQFGSQGSTSLPWMIGGSLSSGSNLTAVLMPNVSYDCDDNLDSLLPSECREAWRQIPRFDGKLHSIGNRSAEQKWDIPLPMRWPSSECTSHAQVMRLLVHQSLI